MKEGEAREAIQEAVAQFPKESGLLEAFRAAENHFARGAVDKAFEKFFDASRMAFVEDVRFRLRVGEEKRRASRRLLVISLHHLSAAEEASLRERYLEAFSQNTVSFPLKERGKHLMTRIDSRIFNYGRAFVNWIPQFRTKAYRLPRARSLEVMLRLTPEEFGRLQTYLANIKRRRARTIGPFTMEGFQQTRGLIDDNRTLKGGHNCSSWIGLSPIGENNLSLLETLGGSRAHEVATNPGWWTSFLASSAPAERIPFILHWTPLPLAEAVKEIRPGANFEWDFNRH